MRRRHLPLLLALLLTIDAIGAPVLAPTEIRGAGATFPAPIYAKWMASYARANSGVTMSYDAVGSEAGIQKLLAGQVDFAASDRHEIVRDLAGAQADDYLLFPSVVGAVVPIVHLPGLARDISLTPEVLADIYLGNITRWNDARLTQINRGLPLPSLDIAVIHRADGSGTSYTWTDLLSRASPEWRARAGTGSSPRWPVGRAVAGNEGVARLVTQVPGAIGYVEYIFAVQAHLSYARVRNGLGEFVAPSLESIAAAVHAADGDAGPFPPLIDSSAAGAYPIVSFTWLVVPAHVADDAKRTALADFLQWMLGSGQRQAAALGYLALPETMAARARAEVSRIR